MLSYLNSLHYLRIGSAVFSIAIVSVFSAWGQSPDPFLPDPIDLSQGVPVLKGKQLMFGSEPLPPLPDGAFTIVVLPDTQAYHGQGTNATPESSDPVTNENFEAQVKWIIANQRKENIVFVSHVGDIVDTSVPEQWAIAKHCLDRIRDILPLSLTVGNHDMEKLGDASLFQQYFPASAFEKYPWYLESFAHDREDQSISGNNVNSAQQFQAGGINFLHISLECSAPDDVLEWAGKLLKNHPEHLGIITTHTDLGVIEQPKSKLNYLTDRRGRMQWHRNHGDRGNSPEQMWNKLYRHHANLDFILCGDQGSVTALRMDTKADDGHTIVSMLSDYMNEPVLRLLRFNPAQEKVDVLTYQVKDGFLVDSTFYVKDRKRHQFAVPLRVAR